MSAAPQNSPKPAGSSGYWSGTRKPLACLIFVVPLLVAYEAGVVWLGGPDSDAFRSGADAWLRGGLEYFGLNRPWLVPAMVVVGLLVWHIAQQEPWRISAGMLSGMLGESLLFACVLVVFAQLQSYGLHAWQTGGAATAAIPTAAIPAERVAAMAVIFLGAGIYEEVLFRLCLMPMCHGLFRTSGVRPGLAAFLAAVATSLAFSLAHYVGPAGEPFRLFSFGFRTFAALFFALLFVLRGFGITVGTHAAYDLIVGLMLTGSH
jgi:Type II CAAX prenyl endopeptidase Rce1-like